MHIEILIGKPIHRPLSSKTPYLPDGFGKKVPFNKECNGLSNGATFFMECRKIFSSEVQTLNTSSVKLRHAFRAITPQHIMVFYSSASTGIYIYLIP